MQTKNAIILYVIITLVIITMIVNYYCKNWKKLTYINLLNCEWFKSSSGKLVFIILLTIILLLFSCECACITNKYIMLYYTLFMILIILEFKFFIDLDFVKSFYLSISLLIWSILGILFFDNKILFVTISIYTLFICYNIYLIKKLNNKKLYFKNYRKLKVRIKN